MVQGAIECVKVGYRSAIALWPLLLVRLAETILIGLVGGGVFFLSLLPLGLSFQFSDIDTVMKDPARLAEWILTNAGTVFYFFVVVLVLAFVAVLIHSYFEAGVASMYLDHIRSGVSFPAGVAWERFSFERFMEAALSRGWSVFLVYNIVWGVAGAVLLIPLGVMLVVLLVFKDSPAAIAFTCFGLVIVMVLAILSSIVAATWSQVGLTISAGERRGPVESTNLASEMMRARLGDTVLLVIIVYAVAFGFSSVTSTFNLALGALAEVPGAEIIALALQIGMVVVNTVVSTVLGLWTAAVWVAFVASASESRVPVLPDSGGDLGTRQALVG